jgi:maleamate amidohydrolase
LLDAMRTWPGSCGLAGWSALPSILELLGTARAAGLPVLHSTGLDSAGMPGWLEAIHSHLAQAPSPTAQVPSDRLQRRYQIIDEVAPIPGEVLIRKSTPSAFSGTPLLGQLVHLGIDTLLVAGESTSGCVRASVVDGASHRFRMIVVEECVFDRHEAAHAINLFDMHQKYADVVPLSVVVDYIKRFRSTKGVRRISGALSPA